MPAASLADWLVDELNAYHGTLFERARKFHTEHTAHPQTKQEFRDFFENGNGFAWAAFCDRTECELELKDQLGGVTARNKPFRVEGGFPDRCVWCEQPATTVAVFARAY